MISFIFGLANFGGSNLTVTDPTYWQTVSNSAFGASANCGVGQLDWLQQGPNSTLTVTMAPSPGLQVTGNVECTLYIPSSTLSLTLPTYALPQFDLSLTIAARALSQ